jgi:class 3 adenylate cyclase
MAMLARGGSTVDLRRVGLLAAAGVAAAVIAMTTLPWIGPMRFGSALLGINAEFSPAILAEDIASGLTLFAAGLIAWVRQPANPIWRLMVASYFADFIWQLAFVPNSAFWTASVLFSFLDAAIFAHLILAFPTGHLRSQVERRLVVSLYVFAIGISLVRLFFWEPSFACDAYCPRNLLLIWPANELADALEKVADLSLPILSVLLAVLLWRHWRSASPPSRRAMLPLVLAFPPILIFVVIVMVAYVLRLDAIVSLSLSPATWVIDFILPIAFLIGVLRLRMTRASVASAVLELGALPTPSRLQELLRSRLGDPSLLVLRWSPAQDAFVDAEGRGVEEPEPGSGLALTVLERDARAVAAVLHDAALLDEPALQQTIAAAAALVMEATDVRDELRARGGQTEGLPDGEVTFLFADIEGSTALLEALGQRYGPLIDDLRRIASEIAEEHSGRLVDARGDELFLAFPLASAAVRSAVGLTRRLERRSWPGGVVVRVRIGLHTGRPELTRSGYVGMDVHRAARIMAEARGGQIVASAAVVDGLDNLDSVAVRPLGSRALRGIAEPIELVAIE